MNGPAEELYTFIHSAIHEADRKYIPRKPVKMKSTPSLPRQFRRLLDSRAHLFAKQRLTQLPEDIAAYRKTRNLCRSEIRAHQRRHQSRVLKVARENKSYLFKYMRRFKKNKPSALLLKIDGIPTTDAESVAKGFRDHFLSVYAETSMQRHPALTSRHYDTALCQVTFDIADIEKLLKRINPYSAMGPDDIHPRILKEAANVLALPLFSLFTDSLLTGVLPAAWKQAHVTPIYKSGDRHSPASYRPISLTSIPCKILERLIKKRSSITFRGTISYLICNMASYLGDPGLYKPVHFHGQSDPGTGWWFWFQTLSSSISPKRLTKSLTSPSSTSYKLMGFVVSFCSGSTHFSPTDLSAWRLIKHCHLPLQSTLASHKALSSGHLSLSGLHKWPKGCHFKPFPFFMLMTSRSGHRITRMFCKKIPSVSKIGRPRGAFP